MIKMIAALVIYLILVISIFAFFPFTDKIAEEMQVIICAAIGVLAGFLYADGLSKMDKD